MLVSANKKTQADISREMASYMPTYFHFLYQDLVTGRYTGTRNSSPCHLHTCEKSLLAAMIGQQSCTRPMLGSKKKGRCLYDSFCDHLLLSFSLSALILCLCNSITLRLLVASRPRLLGLANRLEDQDDGLGDRQPMNDRGIERWLMALRWQHGHSHSPEVSKGESIIIVIIIVRLTLLRLRRSIEHADHRRLLVCTRRYTKRWDCLLFVPRLRACLLASLTLSFLRLLPINCGAARRGLTQTGRIDLFPCGLACKQARV